MKTPEDEAFEEIERIQRTRTRWVSVEKPQDEVIETKAAWGKTFVEIIDPTKENHVFRAYFEQPQRSQEPLCPECKAEILYECVACSRNNYPPQRTWVRLTDREIDRGLLRSGYALEPAAAWRAGVVFAMNTLNRKNTRREWTRLTDKEIEECWDGDLSPYQMQCIREIEARLREKNV